MAYEVPTDMIREVQILLRNQAGIPSYDPKNPSLLALPSLRDSISGFEPSPPYLRCKNCNGRFLRGLASLICVYCGQEQREELPPEPIKFKSTVGYRCLLDALHLDGSEIVGPSIEELESNRAQSKQKYEVSLSDLLDLEIKWSDESVKVGDGVTNSASIQSKHWLNLAAVDLDNFFSESKNDTIASEEQFGPNTLFGDTESNAFQGQKDLNLFENVQHSESVAQTSVDESGGRFAGWEINSTESSTLQGHENLNLVENVRPFETKVHSTNSKNGDRFSGWEAEFQSASSETIHGESSSFDPLGGSTVDLSAHMDTVFGQVNGTKHVKPKDDSALPASTTNNSLKDDIWTNFNSGVSNQAEQIEATMSIGRMQDDQLQTSRTKAPNNPKMDDDDDSFDAWNDFTSSTNTLEPSDSPWKQTSNHTILSAENTSEKNLFGSTTNLQNMEFGSFEQPDLFMGAFNDKNGFNEVNIMQSEASALDRTPDESIKDGAIIGEDHIKATMSSEADNVEMLMSHMHDLSYMLDSNLSIPKS